MAMRHQASVMLVKGHIQTTEVSQLDPEPRSQKGGRMGGGEDIESRRSPPLSGWFLSIQIFGAPSPQPNIFFRAPRLSGV